MNDIVGVHVNDGHEGLGEELKGLGFSEHVFTVLVVKQVAHFGILHYHVYVLCVIECVPYLNDVWVVDL